MKDEQVIVRDIPYFVWLFGLGFLGAGGYLFFRQSAPWFISGLFLVIAVVLVFFVPIVTVSLDRARGLLLIQKTGILQRKRIELPANRVARVYVDKNVSTDSDGTSTTYRVVLVMQDGEEIPLRNSSSSGYSRKAEMAERIRLALDLAEQPAESGSILDPVAGLLSSSESLQTLTGIAPGVHETQGVRWELEVLTFGGVDNGSPVYRWFSADFEIAGTFVFLAQKMKGQGKQKGLMEMAGNLLFKQSIKMYGFDESFTPGLETAKNLENADPRLLQHFFIHTSSPEEAQRVLNPWAVMPLVGWADRYAIEKRSRKFHQLAVLFSPWGVYLSVLNTLDTAQIDQLVALGVELVRAQGPVTRSE